MSSQLSPESPTVFLVDDDEAALKSLRWLLESVNLRVEDYRKAQDFLAAYDPDVPGCLVLDIRMPEISGLELQEELAKRGCQHPIVFVTGHGDVPTCSKAYQNGAFEFIEKPVHDQALLDIVHRAVAKDAQNREKLAKRPDIARHMALLTPREHQVMELIIAGKPVKQIAAELGVGFPTAARHRSRVLEKMCVENDVELVRLVFAVEAV